MNKYLKEILELAYIYLQLKFKSLVFTMLFESFGKFRNINVMDEG